MYSRNFYTEKDVPMIPENYDGTTFREEPSVEKCDTGAPFEEKDRQEDLPKPDKEDVPAGIFSGIAKNLFGGFSLKMPKIGSEEILIIATAIFLFLSKDGDIECAIILLLLLLIN